MKKTTAIALIPAAALTVVAFSSCSVFDPDYKAYKEQQAAAAATNAVPSPVNNPYGVPQAGGETGSYTPTNPSSAPYQPIPGVAQSSAPAAQYTPSAPPAPSVNDGSHTVVADDTLWGLARQYNTSVEAIQASNGLTNTVIRKGQTLVIPSN